jgi:integrase
VCSVGSRRAGRTRQHTGCARSPVGVWRYAVATGRAERDITTDLRGRVGTGEGAELRGDHRARPRGELLRAIHGYQGHGVVAALALKLAPLVFVRPGELRAAEWSEFDLDAAEWCIPAAKMKMGEQHIVPLSRQALGILREIHPLTGRGAANVPPARPICSSQSRRGSLPIGRHDPLTAPPVTTQQSIAPAMRR